MRRNLVVTGTDTDIGKTVFAAGLAAMLGARYWKPVQSGTDGGGDSATVKSLGLSQDRILPSAYSLTTPCSPHRAAEIDRVTIGVDRLDPPLPAGLVIEGAGGVLVPLTREFLYADLFARWNYPVVVVASTRLGTINHSLLTIEALKTRRVPILGIAFVGDANEDSEAVICDIGPVKRLGRLPWLARLTPNALKAAFAEAFRREDFA